MLPPFLPDSRLDSWGRCALQVAGLGSHFIRFACWFSKLCCVFVSFPHAWRRLNLDGGAFQISSRNGRPVRPSRGAFSARTCLTRATLHGRSSSSHARYTTH